jgi:hypothetical protein
MVAVLWQYVLQSVVCVLGAVRRVPESHATQTLTLARFRRLLHDDGPNGPKHVAAI